MTYNLNQVLAKKKKEREVEVGEVKEKKTEIKSEIQRERGIKIEKETTILTNKFQSQNIEGVEEDQRQNQEVDQEVLKGIEKAEVKDTLDLTTE